MSKSKDKKVSIKLTYEWEISEKDYNEARDFMDEIKWKWNDDPMSVLHFLNQMSWPDLVRKSVDRIA